MTQGIRVKSYLWYYSLWVNLSGCTWTIRNNNYNRPKTGNSNKGKRNGAGLAWESKSDCFADKFGKPYTHSFGTDTQHDYIQGNCRTMLSIIIKLMNNE